MKRKTTIKFNEGEDIAIVSTCIESWQKSMERFGAECISIDNFGKKQYQVPRNWIRVPLPPHVENEQGLAEASKRRKSAVEQETVSSKKSNRQS